MEEYTEALAASLEVARENLEKERKQLEELKKSLGGVNEATTGKIKLNVGGTYFTTSRTTLSRDSLSVLASIGSGRWEPAKEDGAYFIDRDPEIFTYVLDYLRNGSLSREVPPGLEEALQREADFFGLQGLLKEEEEEETPGEVTWYPNISDVKSIKHVSARFAAGEKIW